jgi:hypothetical protein
MNLIFGNIGRQSVIIPAYYILKHLLKFEHVLC